MGKEGETRNRNFGVLEWGRSYGRVKECKEECILKKFRLRKKSGLGNEKIGGR